MEKVKFLRSMCWYLKKFKCRGDRPFTNKLQKFTAEYEIYVICARDAGEMGKRGSLRQIL